MNHVTIQFGNKEYKLKSSFRGIMLFEEMTGYKVAEMPDTTGNMLKLFYCMLKACNQESFTFSFDAFLDMIDEYDNSFAQFNDYLISLNGAAGAAEPDKKKVRAKR